MEGSKKRFGAKYYGKCQYLDVKSSCVQVLPRVQELSRTLVLSRVQVFFISKIQELSRVQVLSISRTQLLSRVQWFFISSV